MRPQVAEEVRAAQRHLAGPAACDSAEQRSGLLAVARVRVRLRRHAAAVAAQRREVARLESALGERLAAARGHLGRAVVVDPRHRGNDPGGPAGGLLVMCHDGLNLDPVSSGSLGVVDAICRVDGRLNA